MSLSRLPGLLNTMRTSCPATAYSCQSVELVSPAMCVGSCKEHSNLHTWYTYIRRDLFEHWLRFTQITEAPFEWMSEPHKQPV